MPNNGSSLPSWATRIRRERESRDWSVPGAVDVLRAHATADEAKSLPAKSTLVRRWREWEAGEHNPSEGSGFYAPLLARTFGTARYALFPKSSITDGETELLVATGMDTADILSRMRRSDVDAATLEALARTVERLCSSYVSTPSEQLVEEGRTWLRRVVDLRGQRLTLAQHTDVLVLAGWLALLVGCVENDQGERRAAEATRRIALELGTETGNTSIIGWAHEMKAWFALTDGDYRGVITAARAGTEATSTHGVAVQLLAQEAKAWARLGDRRQMEVALDRGRRVLETLPYPDNLDNHFVVDPGKYDFYVMDCYRLAGMDTLAGAYADEVIRASTTPSGVERSPMRIAEARLTLGVVAAREGELDQAVSHGHDALQGDRKSLPSLLMVSGELGGEIGQRYPTAPTAREYFDELHELRAVSVPH